MVAVGDAHIRKATYVILAHFTVIFSKLVSTGCGEIDEIVQKTDHRFKKIEDSLQIALLWIKTASYFSCTNGTSLSSAVVKNSIRSSSQVRYFEKNCET